MLEKFWQIFYGKEKVDALGNKRARKNHLQKFLTCAACGSKDKLQVHHCKPFHIDPDKELCEDNFITLCEKNNCHFLFGHLGSWCSYNENVHQDASQMLEKIKNRPM